MGVASKLRVLEGEQKPCAYSTEEVINLASNNYLGLTTHRRCARRAGRGEEVRVGAGRFERLPAR